MRKILKLIAAAAIPLGALLTAPAAAALSPAPPGARELQRAGTPSGISGGALFGGDQGLLRNETGLGRKLAVVRIYYDFGDTFPLPGNAKLMAAGRTLLVSLDSNGASYASIAAGQQDSLIMPFLTAVNQAAVQYNLSAIYICFEHEPDSPQHHSLGTPAQFIQAWDHVRQLAVSASLDWNNGGRLHWTWIMIHSSFLRNSAYASQFWPGSSEVDIIAADGYNSSGCNGKASVTPASVFDPLLAFAAAHGGPPVFVSEWGSTDNPAGTQPAFINGMQAYVAANPVIAAALYWNSGGAECSYIIDSNPASISALATMGQSAAMQGHLS